MEEGHLSAAPVYSNLESFPARRYRGKVDLVTAGFPCQPFSVAGKQQAEKDPRHLWPHIAHIIGECKPALVFLENVSLRAFVEPWRDLRRLGFNLSRPFACTAAELGAGHLRRRVFVLAYRDSESCEMGSAQWEGMSTLGGDGALAPNAEHWPRQQPGRRSGKSRQEEGEPRPTPSDSTSAGLEGRLSTEGTRSQQGFSPRDGWWASEPPLERVVHGVPNRVDRDRALGNAVVPQQAAFAFASLIEEMNAT